MSSRPSPTDEDLLLVERGATSGAARRPPAGPPGPGAGPGLLGPLRDLPEVGPEAVVAGTGVGVGQHVVRLVDLLEPLLGGRVLVHVRVVAAGQLAVGPLDLVGVGGARDPEDLVVVTGHRGLTPALAGWRPRPRPGAASGRPAVAGPQDLDHRARPAPRRLDHPDRLVAGRVERHPDLLVAREAEPGQRGQGLVAHRPDALHDRARVAAGVGQRPVQVVQHRQELGGHPGPLGGPLPLQLPRVALAEVVEVGEGPAPAVLQVGQRGRGGGLVDLESAVSPLGSGPGGCCALTAATT